MNTERTRELIRGLTEQVSQIDSLAPSDCPEWLIQERELMVDEIKGLEARIKRQSKSLQKVTKSLQKTGRKTLTKVKAGLSLGEVA